VPRFPGPLHSKFTQAKLTQAKLTQAKLTQAKLTQAKLTLAKLTLAKLILAPEGLGGSIERCDLEARMPRIRNAIAVPPHQWPKCLIGRDNRRRRYLTLPAFTFRQSV
jgi:hypothetical protein